MAETQKTLYLVFANAVPGKEAEFDTWYDAHIAQILAIDGFESARRMTKAEIDGRPSPEHTYVAAYEIKGDPNEAFGRLKVAREAGNLSMPDPDVVALPFKGVVYSMSA